MRKTTTVLLVLTFCLTGLASAQERGGGGRGGGDFGGGGGGWNGGGGGWSGGDRGNSGLGGGDIRSGRPGAQGVSRSSAAGFRGLGLPSKGPHGSSFRGTLVTPRAMSSGAVRNNMAVVNNAGFRSRISNYNAHENVVGRYYWHNYNGNNFCHYYDQWGCNWYGWYCGAGFYWSCWWDNNWWWYDPLNYQWCYWNNGWYYQDPGSTQVYVYNNGQYVPAESNEDQTQAAGDDSQNDYSDDSQNAVESNQSETATAAPVSPLSSLKTYFSKDQTRKVQVVGASRDAFLYDTSGTPAFKTKYLASDVVDVRFSKVAKGKPLQIMLGLADGSFELYDADGNSAGGN
jgi:hypothetical protein